MAGTIADKRKALSAMTMGAQALSATTGADRAILYCTDGARAPTL